MYNTVLKILEGFLDLIYANKPSHKIVWLTGRWQLDCGRAATMQRSPSAARASLDRRQKPTEDLWLLLAVR